MFVVCLVLSSLQLTTPGIRLLQEATDKALDAVTGTAAPTANPNGRASARFAVGDSSKPGAADAEAGQAGSGLTDWQETQQALEARSWSGWFSMAAGKLGMDVVREGLSQREVCAAAAAVVGSGS